MPEECGTKRVVPLVEVKLQWQIMTIDIVTTEQEYAVEIAICPHCNGLFGVDSTYLDQKDSFVNCPMCSCEVEILEQVNGSSKTVMMP